MMCMIENEEDMRATLDRMLYMLYVPLKGAISIAITVMDSIHDADCHDSFRPNESTLL